MTTSIPDDLLERIWFYVNFDCNLRCSYCVVGPSHRRTGPRLELRAFQTLIDQAVDIGFKHAAITGGEPFLHPDIIAMIEYATARIDTVVLTNATLLTRESLSALAQADRSRLTVQISLNNADPRIDDEWRGTGTWEQALRGLELLMKANYTTVVRATLDGPDEASLLMLREFLMARGLPEEQVYGVPVARVGRASHGIALSRERLWPEPTIIGNSLYWHPLQISPTDIVAPSADPLASALKVLMELFHEVKPVKRKDVR